MCPRPCGGHQSGDLQPNQSHSRRQIFEGKQQETRLDHHVNGRSGLTRLTSCNYDETHTI